MSRPPRKTTATPRRATGTASSTAGAASSSSSRHGKSRPAHLAQMHLAVLKNLERCRELGQEPSFTGDDMRQILQDQSGSKAHHAPLVRNPCEDQDPLRHILKESTACGAGSDASVFRPDAHHFGVLMWPKLRLEPILDELDLMQRDWERQCPPPAHDPLESLLNPTGRSKAHYAPARPLY